MSTDIAESLFAGLISYPILQNCHIYTSNGCEEARIIMRWSSPEDIPCNSNAKRDTPQRLEISEIEVSWVKLSISTNITCSSNPNYPSLYIILEKWNKFPCFLLFEENFLNLHNIGIVLHNLSYSLVCNIYSQYLRVARIFSKPVHPLV